VERDAVTVQREATVYPRDALAWRTDLEVVVPEKAPTLPSQFRARVGRSPGRTAYREFERGQGAWRDYTWAETARDVARWQAALAKEGLKPGDRVALRLRNCRAWVLFDQAALGLGLVVVPLYVDDRVDNVAYVLDDSGASLLLVETEEHWHELDPVRGKLGSLQRIVVLGAVTAPGDERVVAADGWLPAAGGDLRAEESAPGDLASIVYTSGTTGRPKGVMLSHSNIVENAYAGLRSIAVLPSDIFLSFLPLCHTLERTAGYYLAMMAGSTVAYARSIPDLAEDLQTIRPTILVSVPRIFERVCGRIKTQLEEGTPLKRRLFDATVNTGWGRFEHRHGRGPWRPSFLLWPLLDALVARKVRARFGGRLRLAVSGGAPLPPAVARVFIGLGVELLQGYGLTEGSPIVSANTPELNLPQTIGLPLHGVRARIADNDELIVRGPNVMLGYWRNEEATRAVIDPEGWLHTGDLACIEDGFIQITGRLKDIIVMANGEKVAPADLESAIAEDPLFEHAMVVGEGMPYLSVLLVLNRDLWRQLAAELGLNPDAREAIAGPETEQALLARIGCQIRTFPGSAQIRRAAAALEPWSVNNGLLTPTLKLRRSRINERFRATIARLYEGHVTSCPPRTGEPSKR
jgi:long-chain acyl-CoA synthetase